MDEIKVMGTLSVVAVFWIVAMFVVIPRIIPTTRIEFLDQAREASFIVVRNKK